MSRDVFARAALGQIPTILTLLDRNPHSPSYGCFDRNYWHYRLIDFPSGMSQEFVYPLALVYDMAMPDNPYHGQPSIRSWAEAGIDYAARSAHANGSCDDYFPYEQAAGAAAFSLLACVETYDLLKLRRNDLCSFFARRAEWLARHDESGQLSNHQALIALALHRTGQVVADEQWNAHRDYLIDRLIHWQSSEGWFPEYEGMDTGYQTLTLWCLGMLYDDCPAEELREAITRCVELLHWFVHPDGTFGGEYNSRNTLNFFPAGFERVGRWLPEALSINDRFANALTVGNSACYADDHIIGHHTWNYLLAWRDWFEPRPAGNQPPSGRRYIKDAGVIVDRGLNHALYVALNKGGVYRYFRDGRLVRSDTQISAKVRERGRLLTAVAHLVSEYQTDVADDEIRVSGAFAWAKQTQMTSVRLLLLRVGMLTIGRFFPNLVRAALQRMLIVGSRAAPLAFTRTLNRRGDRWYVRDEVTAKHWQDVESLGVGGDQTSIYVVMSRTYHPAQLQPWLDLTGRVGELADGEALVLLHALDEEPGESSPGRRAPVTRTET